MTDFKTLRITSVGSDENPVDSARDSTWRKDEEGEGPYRRAIVVKVLL